MERLLPDPGPTSVPEALAGFDPRARVPDERPFVFTNFAETLDGHATLDGRSGEIAGDTDLQVLLGLRERADAVMVGAGTLRAERYGRIIAAAERRKRRREAGLESDALAVVVSERLAVPWDIPLFSSGAGEVVVFTASEKAAPETATPCTVIRHPGGVDLSRGLAELRAERGIEALLCEGGPHLHAALLTSGLVDELFVTIGAKLAGGAGPRITEGLPGGPIDLGLVWLLREGDELYTRWSVRR